MACGLRWVGLVILWTSLVWMTWCLNRSWTLGISQSTYVSMVQAVNNAVGPLNALGLTSSYQNEGSAWETNWQEGKGHHMLLTPVNLITFITLLLKPSLVTSTTSCSRSNINTIRPTVRLAGVFFYILILYADDRSRV